MGRVCDAFSQPPRSNRSPCGENAGEIMGSRTRSNDPTDAPGTYSKTGPFNPNFLAKLRKLRGARLEAFSAYRKSVDLNGLFYNEFLRNLLES
jgi:hypothetical protein